MKDNKIVAVLCEDTMSYIRFSSMWTAVSLTIPVTATFPSVPAPSTIVIRRYGAEADLFQQAETLQGFALIGKWYPSISHS
jgi:hypothetical protein